MSEAGDKGRRLKSRAFVAARLRQAERLARYICSNPILPSSPFFQTYQT